MKEISNAEQVRILLSKYPEIKIEITDEVPYNCELSINDNEYTMFIYDDHANVYTRKNRIPRRYYTIQDACNFVITQCKN
jgi:hypothetical protein